MAASTYPYIGKLQNCKRIAQPTNLLIPKGKVTGFLRETNSVAALVNRLTTTPIAIGVNSLCDAMPTVITNPAFLPMHSVPAAA